MANFNFDKAKDANVGHMAFELNCSNYLYVLRKNTNPCLQLKSVDKLVAKLQDLITVYQKNFYHAQALQKQVHNEDVNSKNYVFGDKVWLNCK